MRKLALVVALASTALAGPAFAKDKAWYVGVEGGAMLVEDSNYSIAGVNNALKVNQHYGFDVDGIVGYDFGLLRIEGEAGYKRSEVEGFATSIPLGGAPAGNYNSSRSGNTSALSFMVNALLDFGDEKGVSGYVGGGAGVARVKADSWRFGANAADLVDDSDTRFAWQAIAGVRAPITNNIDVGVKYRFFNVNDTKFVTTSGAEADGRFRSHSLLASLIFNFGEPAAPPPPPPPPPPAAAPPPPPPPPPPAANPGPFIVFFDWNKSDVTPEAASILDNAAAAYAQTGSASVMLAGYTDTSGTPKYNMALSQRRADAVKAYLAGKGVPDAALTTQAFGETHLLVQTADGVREPQNRRVEITFGPGSGQ